MRIYITGATGFIGKNIEESLVEKHDVFLYKRNSPILEDLNRIMPNVIVHCAAEIYNTDLMFESNILLTHNILEYCSKNTNIKLIYLGSSSEYGKTDKKMSEDDLISPESLYAATKSCGTLLCQAYSKMYNFNCSIIRPFSIYGKYEPKHRLIPTIFRCAINDEKITLIEGNHDYFYILDFINYFQLLIEDHNIYHGKIFNFGFGEQVSNLNVLKTIEKIIGKNINYGLKKEKKLVDSDFWVCENKLIIDTFKIKPKYNLENGILDYYNKNHHKI